MDTNNLQDFILSPDTVPLIVYTDILTPAFLADNPNIQLGKSFPGGYTIIYTDRAYAEQVIDLIYSASHNLLPLIFGLMGEAELTASGITQVQQHPALDLRGHGVLLGFIDTGIDYTQNAFRYEDGSSKIAAIWDQTMRGRPPEGYHYGSEYSNNDINAALLSDNPQELVPHQDTAGHGTFLASVAGSREPGTYIGAAPDAEIIAVKLKRAQPYVCEYFLVPPELKDVYATDDIMMGVQYILDTARKLGRPVAICLGLGSNIGSHNGFTALEEYLSNIAGIPGTAMCVAAGNESQSGHHTMGRLGNTGDTQDIDLRVGTAAQDIYLSIWNYAVDRLSVSIRTPTGLQIARIPARSDETFTQRLPLERSMVSVTYQFPIQRSGEQLTRIKIWSATQGVWRITVHGDVVLDGTYHAWLPVTALSPPNIQFLSPVPNYTVTAPATAVGVITCGAYDSRSGALSPTSSWGPTRLPAIAPDLVAPGVDVTGIFPYGHGTMGGTSVAAAITAGACALMLQWGVVEGHDASYDSFRIRAKLIAGCDRTAGLAYPNNQWGFGRLNLMATFEGLRPV
ncbi:MAG: S8 family peptidase [Oscillospiraceae bacterium]|nr:S8 family peptidase [Oscillospiraceae bacterium]